MSDQTPETGYAPIKLNSTDIPDVLHGLAALVGNAIVNGREITCALHVDSTEEEGLGGRRDWSGMLFGKILLAASFVANDINTAIHPL